MQDAALPEKARDFVARYLPAGLHSAHALLYGAPERAAVVFVPTADALTNCLNDYAALLAVFAKERTFQLLHFALMEASELVIAYLNRWQTAGQTLPRRDELVAFIRARESQLTALVKLLGGNGTDALRRLLTVADLLEDRSEEPQAG